MHGHIIGLSKTDQNEHFVKAFVAISFPEVDKHPPKSSSGVANKVQLGTYTADCNQGCVYEEALFRGDEERNKSLHLSKCQDKLQP